MVLTKIKQMLMIHFLDVSFSTSLCLDLEISNFQQVSRTPQVILTVHVNNGLLLQQG